MTGWLSKAPAIERDRGMLHLSREWKEEGDMEVITGRPGRIRDRSSGENDRRLTGSFLPVFHWSGRADTALSSMTHGNVRVDNLSGVE